ncbi:ankyrin repeat-containing domain protein [Chytridium lagenaria]|nr:ankyrin repeat-containing domain protein [Chytridium lagenaria]
MPSSTIQSKESLFTSQLPSDILRMIMVYLHPHKIKVISRLLSRSSSENLFDDIAFARQNLRLFLLHHHLSTTHDIAIWGEPRRQDAVASLTSPARGRDWTSPVFMVSSSTSGPFHFPSPSSSPILSPSPISLAHSRTSLPLPSSPDLLPFHLLSLNWPSLGPSYISPLLQSLPLTHSLLSILFPSLSFLAISTIDPSPTSPLQTPAAQLPHIDPTPLITAITNAATLGAFSTPPSPSLIPLLKSLDASVSLPQTSPASISRLLPLLPSLSLLTSLGILTALNRLTEITHVLAYSPCLPTPLISRLLITSAIHGSLAAFKHWSSIHPSPPYTTALESASSHGQLPIVTLLISLGVTPSPQSLTCAAARGHLTVVQALLYANVEVSGDAFKSIIEASDAGFTDIVKCLIQNLKHDDHAEPAIIEALQRSALWGHEKCVETLLLFLEKTVQKGVRSEKGWVRDVITQSTRKVDPFTQVLIIAATEGHESIVSMSIQIGVRTVEQILECVMGTLIIPDASVYHSLALRKAAANGHHTIVEMLLGVKTIAAAWKGHASAAAQNHASLYRATENNHIACVQLLLLPTTPLVDPLITASRNGNLDLVKLFLSNIPSVGGRNNAAVQEAAANGHAEIVALLITRPGCDVNVLDGYALRMAAARGFENVVERLLELSWEGRDGRAASVDPTSCDFFAPRQALKNGHGGVVRMFVEYAREVGEAVERGFRVGGEGQSLRSILQRNVFMNRGVITAEFDDYYRGVKPDVQNLLTHTSELEQHQAQINDKVDKHARDRQQRWRVRVVKHEDQY